MTRMDKQEFLAWAYDDLLANTTRGVLAEYIVARALGIGDTKRLEWDRCDLYIDGVGVEVKSSACVQTWEQTRMSESSTPTQFVAFVKHLRDEVLGATKRLHHTIVPYGHRMILPLKGQ